MQVKRSLDDLGCTDAWLHQSKMGYNFQYFKSRSQDQFRQSWSTQIHACSKLDYYRMFKTTFEMETNLTSIQSSPLITQLARLRLSSHSLEIETGRYRNTPRENRICKLCHLNVVESKFHFISVCPLYYDIRKTYIPQPWPS
jgi:hypothetical protein